MARRLLGVADQAPASDAAFRACVWVFEAGDDPAAHDRALVMLAEHHALAHLGLPTEPPELAPAPPQPDFAW